LFLRCLAPLQRERWSVQIVDVSKNGLGLLAPTKLSPGVVVQIQSGTTFALGEVRHSRRISEHQFHIGIKLQDVVAAPWSPVAHLNQAWFIASESLSLVVWGAAASDCKTPALSPNDIVLGAGSGDGVCLGSLTRQIGFDAPCVDIATRAVEVAARHNPELREDYGQCRSFHALRRQVVLDPAVEHGTSH
jgi:hypothetical protein